ncbi:hypothetical protein BC830DRAFT_17224 [Chytriomyces sp. MP71]|nr:hypothetical protein BC830DRAFT_17224 [Chytriomyces sp. MP71]
MNNNKDLNEMETTVSRVQAHKGVHDGEPRPGIVIATHDGSVIRSTLYNIQTQQYSTLVTQLAAKGKGVVRDLDPAVAGCSMSKTLSASRFRC